MVRGRGEQDLNLADRLRAVGVPLERDEFEECLIVRQSREPFVNSIASRFLTRNYIGLTIHTYITIISNSRDPLRLCGFQVRLPWTDSPIELLQTPSDSFAPPTCKFPGQVHGGFDKSQLIVQFGKKLTRGQSVEGFLLGYHGDPIPRSFRHGAKVPVVLTIADQFGEFYLRELRLTVDRTAERGPKPAPPRPRRRLFDKSDKPKREAQLKGSSMETTAAFPVRNQT
jgi:hypothetical protein